MFITREVTNEPNASGALPLHHALATANNTLARYQSASFGSGFGSRGGDWGGRAGGGVDAGGEDVDTQCWRQKQRANVVQVVATLLDANPDSAWMEMVGKCGCYS